MEIIIKSNWAKKWPYFAYNKIKKVFERKLLLKIDKNLFNFVNPHARKEVLELIESGNSKGAVKLASFLESIGFLSFESDNDLFEKLTKP